MNPVMLVQPRNISPMRKISDYGILVNSTERVYFPQRGQTLQGYGNRGYGLLVETREGAMKQAEMQAAQRIIGRKQLLRDAGYGVLVNSTERVYFPQKSIQGWSYGEDETLDSQVMLQHQGGGLTAAPAKPSSMPFWLAGAAALALLYWTTK